MDSVEIYQNMWKDTMHRELELYFCRKEVEEIQTRTDIQAREIAQIGNAMHKLHRQIHHLQICNVHPTFPYLLWQIDHCVPTIE